MRELVGRYWALVVFALFVADVLFFGRLYHGLYSVDPSSFVFQSDVANQQQQAATGDVQRRLTQLLRQQQLLRELTTLLAGGRLPEVAERGVDGRIAVAVLTTAGARYEFALGYPLMAVPEMESQFPRLPSPMLTVSDLAFGTRLGHWVCGGSSVLAGTASGYQRVTRDCRAVVEKELEAVRWEQTAVASGRRHWTYWDFVYFSTITACTIGYGDMLPNRTAVRMVVVIQALVSTFLLGFAVTVGLERLQVRGGA